MKQHVVCYIVLIDDREILNLYPVKLLRMLRSEAAGFTNSDKTK